LTRYTSLFRLALLAAAIFAVVMALLPHPPPVLGHTNDKFQHMTAFGTLTILYCLAFPRESLLRIGERLSFLGALIEVLQSIPSLHRDCDIMDWIADTAVIVGVLVVVRIVRARRASTL
jgi:VanZ family protein